LPAILTASFVLPEAFVPKITIIFWLDFVMPGYSSDSRNRKLAAKATSRTNRDIRETGNHLLYCPKYGADQFGGRCPEGITHFKIEGAGRCAGTKKCGHIS